MMNRKHCAFTLIELLIVVAIIAILAAIAVPNFLEAQTRSKVSRSLADMRSLKTALEAYAVDYNHYPLVRMNIEAGLEEQLWGRGGIHGVWDLTTPVAYMTSVNMADPFTPAAGRDEMGGVETGDWLAHPYSYSYMNIDHTRKMHNIGDGPLSYPKFLLLSFGPDKVRGPDAEGATPQWGVGSYAYDPIEKELYRAWQYDSTNGTTSAGDILVWQK